MKWSNTHTLRTFFDGNKPLVIARDGEQLDLVTWRDDRDAGPVGWRIHWTGEEPDAYREIGARLAGGVYHYEEEPASYFLVETCSQQYGLLFGPQVWRIEGGKVTHDAWFECGWEKDDPINAVKELYDIYDDEFTIDIDALRVVESENNHYFHLVY